jgi:sulfite exporter TauE/SafE
MTHSVHKADHDIIRGENRVELATTGTVSALGLVGTIAALVASTRNPDMAGVAIGAAVFLAIALITFALALRARGRYLGGAVGHAHRDRRWEESFSSTRS